MKPASILDRKGVAWSLVALAFGAQAVLRALTPVGDQDSFWLASAGRLAWNTGAVPHENTFSFVDEHMPWVCHEMGFAMIYAKGLSWMGPEFLNAFGIACGAITTAIVAWFVARDAKRPAAFALVMLPLLVEVPVFHPRPPFASLAFVAAMIALAFSSAFDWRRAAACVALEWCWTQCHGSFPLGVVLLVVSALDDARGRREKLIAATLGALVTFANPYGASLHGLVARYASGGDAVARVIHENVEEFLPVWRAPHAFGSFDAPAVALVTLVAIHAIVRGDRCSRRPAFGRSGDRWRGAFVLILSALAIYQVRQVHLAFVVGAMLLARHVGRSIGARDEEETPRASACVLPGALVALVVVAFVSRRPHEAMLGANVGGPALVPLLERVPAGAHVYAPFGVSPAVIWYGSPRGLQILYDSRNDCYEPDVARAALHLEFDDASKRDAARTLEKFAPSFAFARSGGLVETSLVTSGAWRVVDSRGGLTLFARH